ncbi:MAG: hypothetical protein RI985_1620, partial [Chloroflexota bacterium]
MKCVGACFVHGQKKDLMPTPHHNWLALIRHHRLRLLIVEYVQASYRPALGAGGVVLAIGLMSQFVPIAWRTSLILCVVIMWSILTAILHHRRWHTIALVRRLDVAYGWQSALTTMVDCADRNDDIAV